MGYHHSIDPASCASIHIAIEYRKNKLSAKGVLGVSGAEMKSNVGARLQRQPLAQRAECNRGGGGERTSALGGISEKTGETMV